MRPFSISDKATYGEISQSFEPTGLGVKCSYFFEHATCWNRNTPKSCQQQNFIRNQNFALLPLLHVLKMTDFGENSVTLWSIYFRNLKQIRVARIVQGTLVYFLKDVNAGLTKPPLNFDVSLVILGVSYQLIEPVWRIYESVNQTNIGSHNSFMTHVRCKPDIWINDGYIANWTLPWSLNWNSTLLIQKIICKCRGQNGGYFVWPQMCPEK